MIYYCVSRQHSYTISWFLENWASQALKNHLRYIPYDLLPTIEEVYPGTFIFSDLERLNSLQLEVIKDFCDQITAFDANLPIINHPRFVLCRSSLLRKLYDMGYNKYNIYPAADMTAEPHYPVFLRMENDHNGPRTKLLHDRTQRNAGLMQAVMQGADTDKLKQIEFCETKSTDGYYRKYAAFRIGAQIIPGHIVFEQNWIAKDDNPPEDSRDLEEKRNYMRHNPHAGMISEIFDLAGITYGRIDYSMMDDSIQTWEINTNPILIRPADKYKQEEVVLFKKDLAKKIDNCLLSLNYGAEIASVQKSDKRISFDWNIEKYF